MKEDASWSTVGSGGVESNCSDVELELNLIRQHETIKIELATKEELLQNLQVQLEDLKGGMKALEQDKELAVKLLQASLRTETLLGKLHKDSIEQDIVDTVQTLADGSTTFNVSELMEKAIKFGKTALERRPNVAAGFLIICDGNSNLKNSELEEMALMTIQSHPKILLNGDACSKLSAVGIEKILKDPKMEADEHTMFQILTKWTEATCQSTEENRKRVASKLVGCIALDLIDPTLLGTAIRDSGLVTDAQLVDAFTKQAPFAKNQLPYKNKRTGAKSPVLVWKSSNARVISQKSNSGVIMDTIVGRVMTSGLHKWSLCVEKVGSPGQVCFGIALASKSQEQQAPTSAHYLGHAPGELSFCASSIIKIWYTDRVKSTKIPQLLKIQDNSIVTFTLVLGKINCLTASVDGGQSVVLFTGDEIQHGGSGFVPAASIYSGTSVRFLGFE